jgi:glycosyltransferase involved in cell wall biosynthesis
MKKDKKRILLFVKVPPPVTGATLMNLRVYESELLKNNFIIRSIAISYIKKLDEMGKWQLVKILKIISVFFKLLNELVFFRPRFVYFQISPHGFAFYRDLLYVSLIKLFRVKILYHIHGKGMKVHVKNKNKKRLYTFAFHREEVICLSNLLKGDIEDFFDGKIHIVNNGIPAMSKNEISQIQKIDNRNVRILFLSNLIKSKGIVDYVDALEILKDRDVSFEANIIGATADVTVRELNDYIKQKNLEAFINYKGSKYGTDKNEIIANSDVLVYPTFNDAFPLVLIEAMQFSIPVIATYEGAIPEIVDDSITGYLVEKNAPQQIAEKLKFLIENPEQRKAMGMAGREKFEEKYTLKVFENNLLKLFDEVIEIV